jgi:DNA-binding CsgD family transcriptional regulator
MVIHAGGVLVSGLGLDAVAETVYLTALTRVRWRLADLARHVDIGGQPGHLRTNGCLGDGGDGLRSDGPVAAVERPRPGGCSTRAADQVCSDDRGAARGRSRFDPGLVAAVDQVHPDGGFQVHSDGGFVAAVDRLRVDGLLVASAEESDAVRAVDPALALPALAASRVWGLSAGDSRPQALSIAQLIARHQASGADRLHGLDEMNSFAEHLVANARREVVILSGRHRTGSFEFAVPVAEAVLRRGAELRLLWRSELIRTPTVAAHATWLRTRGAPPRIVPTLPTTMLLVDRSVAVVTTGDDAVVNRAASAVSPLCVLADQLWANSYSGTRRQHPADQTPRHHKVLRLLADGLTDDAIARQVGVSVRTVRNDMAAAMLSLDARSRFQAGVRAAQLGLL